MKIKIVSSLLLFSLFLISLPALSQESTFEIGVEGGPNALFLRGDYPSELSDPLAGANLGLAFQYNFSNRTSIRTGILLQRKRSAWDVDFTDNKGEILDVDVSQSFDFVSIPLLFRVYFGEERNIFVNVGPYASINLSDHYDVSGSDSEGFEGVVLFNGGFVDTYDYGITGGFGLNILTLGPLKIAGEVRNEFGLANISSKANPTVGDVKTNTPTLLLSVMLAL